MNTNKQHKKKTRKEREKGKKVKTAEYCHTVLYVTNSPNNTL